MIQQHLKIGKIEIPIVVEDDETYYPISFISEKLLLRSGSIVTKGNKGKYEKFIRAYSIGFGIHGIHKTNCISSEGLKQLLGNMKPRRLSVNQRKLQNRLMKHLGLPLLSTDEYIIESINTKEMNRHDDYIRSLIANILQQDESIKFQMCSKCTKYYPLASNFYNPDKRLSTGYAYICHICSGRSNSFTHIDNELNKLRKSTNGDAVTKNKLVNAYLNGDVIKIYESCIKKSRKESPSILRNKDNILVIIDHLYAKGLIHKDNITYNKLMQLNIDVRRILTLNDVYTHLFGEDYYLSPWRYKSFQFKEIKLTYEIANKVLSRYLDEHHIDISNPLTLDYESLLRLSKLTHLNNDVLYFAVQYNNFNFAGYQFQTRAVNYYKKLKNRIHDMKYLIEKDLKISIDKIPLYLTKGYLNRERKKLYQVLRNTYHGNLYTWINECYPNRFIEADFNIGKYRDKFDSIEESQIHELLKLHCSNVIYNSRNCSQTIKINGMIPDWLILTDNGCWIVEYFGMYTPNHNYNSMIADYIVKTENKIQKYNKLKGYSKLFVFPEDIKENFEGLRKKLNNIV